MRGKFKHHSHSETRLLQANYDEIFALTGECRICLTKQQIAWILSQADYASWSTRWLSGGQVDQNIIFGFQADMVRRLMDCLPCSGDDELYLLRQNPLNPCQLEQSTDGGVNWSLAFDYELCLFDQALNPPEVRINPDTGNVQYSIDEGGTWYDAPPPSAKTPLKTDLFQDKSDPACWHAANATEIIRKMVMDTGDDLILLIDVIINIMLTIITGGATLPILITNLVSAAVAFGLGAIRSHMETPGEWEKLQCILYCNHDESWGWSPLGWDAAIDDIGTEFPAGVSLFLGGLIQIMGSIGLTSAGYMPVVESADCASCSCNDQCDEPLTSGEHIYAGDGVGGWTLLNGVDMGSGIVQSVYAANPNPEILVRLCFDATFQFSQLQLQVQKVTPGITAAKWEAWGEDEAGVVVVQREVFWDANTGGFTWQTFTKNVVRSGVKSVYFKLSKVPNGHIVEFKNIKVTVS